MLWLYLTILSYFLFSILDLVDKFLVSTRLNAKIYTFYIGSLSLFSFIFIPFFGFPEGSLLYFILAFFAGVIFTLGSFLSYSGLEKFSASKIIPIIGGLTPIFILILSSIFSDSGLFSSNRTILAILFSSIGTFFVALTGKKIFDFKSLGYAIPSAFLFAVYIVLIKNVYDNMFFLHGMMIMSLGSFLIALILAYKHKEKIFGGFFGARKFLIFSRTSIIFLSSRVVGGVGFLILNYAISIVPLSYLALVNALKGLEYIFLLLLIFATGKIFKYTFLEHKLNKRNLIVRIIGIILIFVGIYTFSLI